MYRRHFASLQLDKLSVILVRYRTQRSTTLFKVGPRLIMRLLLVMLDSSGRLVKFVKDELIGRFLGSQHVESDAFWLFSRLDGICFNHLQEFGHAIRVDFRVDHDSKGLVVGKRVGRGRAE